MDEGYFKKFYQHDAENKAKQSEDEFLTGAGDFYTKYDFGVQVAGWDGLTKKSLEAELLAAKGKTPRHIESLGRLIAGEFARHKDVRRITDGETNIIAKILLREPMLMRDAKPKSPLPALEEDIMKDIADGLRNPVMSNKIDFERCKLYSNSYTSGAIIYIRDELIKKRGLAEFREEGIMPADPHKYFERDYMGLAPTPPDYTITPQIIVSLRPLKEEAAYCLSGDLITKHKNDVDFYKMPERLSEIGEFTLNTQMILSTNSPMKYLKTSPKFSTRRDNRIQVPFPTHSILREYYAGIYEEKVSPQGKLTYTICMQDFKMTSKQRNAYNRARMDKMERGKKPRVSPYPGWYIFKFGGFFFNERNFFAEVNAYAVQCGLQKPGEFFDMAPVGMGLQTRMAMFVQMAVREVSQPFPHLEAIWWWDDPPTPNHRPGGRSFHLFGASIAPIGKCLDAQGNRISPYKHTFLALELPTAGVLRIPIFGPGLPLYKEDAYKAYLAGKLDGLRIGGQFFTITQPHPECCALPSRTPSIMPRCSIFFGKTKSKKLQWEGNL